MQILRRLHHLIHLNSKARADIRWWNSFLPSWNGISMFISPDLNYAEFIQLYRDASGTCGFGAYTWMEPGSEATAHTSASRAGRALKGCLRHLLHRAVAPSTSTTYRAGIRKHYAFCHKFNLTTLPVTKHSINLFSVKWGVRKDRLWEREVFKVGMLTPLDFVPRGGRDMAVKAEGGVEEAALLRPGVVGPLASLELLTCVGVAGLRRRAALRR